MKTIQMKVRKSSSWKPVVFAVILISLMIGLRSNMNSVSNQPYVTSDTVKPPPEKKYPVTLTQTEWDVVLNWLDIAKAQLNKSNLPSNDVRFVCDSMLAKFQYEVVRQVQPQLPKVDTAALRKKGK